MDTFLWGALPYVVFGVLVTGLAWRYRYDQFGWTTRSSESYESRILNIASPMFHYGILFVLLGHLMGLFVPSSWTDALGLDEHAYNLLSLFAGTAAGALAVVGIGMLIYRRRRYAPVFRATTRNDKLMYAVLVAAIVLGLVAKLTHAGIETGYDYRDTIAPWARSLFTLDPKVGLMADAPVAFQVHAVVGMVLFALLPFTRLVHMFSAPVQYLFRPYIVYRSRDPHDLATRPDRRGWERIGQR
ncbi:respiratory nitrate reductase subunit gamma [Yinghuangia seranimata]|uniref:respiratory nitrate reductase subunit gamma n=1 Tax=Yinghuangia seranimata TaxID=408067 RepID=UPI00248CA63D|nr:respiratory nitrate reductase subunit gamma [Yinghuangia seranimata]MDI2127885.1 respiratory nitrate reductase subunit gamma [Yinghuangia seranimata]